jgi:Mor family transcriptional regulator
MARQIYLDYINDITINAKDLIKKYPIKYGAILNILNKKCWKDATKDLPDAYIQERVRGEKWCKSKLKEEDVINILRLYTNDNIKILELSKKYNVSYEAIYGIITKKRWKHIIV